MATTYEATEKIPASGTSASDTSFGRTVSKNSGKQLPDTQVADLEDQDAQKFQKLSWQRLTIVLIVEAIALGSLSMPSSFDTLGMVGGILMTVGIGLVTIYTGYLVGLTCNKYPTVQHYADICHLLFGKVGGEIWAWILIIYLMLSNASHALTGAIAFSSITNGAACKVVWAVVSTVILFILALPRTFSEMAVLGYIDFISILAAIVMTMIATSVRAHDQPGGVSAVNWNVGSPHPKFYEAVLATTNVCFAFSFSVAQPSFQTELANRGDFMKAIWALGAWEIVIYTLTGAIIYSYVGVGVASPAIGSAGHTMARITYGVALPVIFISGAINVTTAARAAHFKLLGHTKHRHISTPWGILAWVSIVGILNIIGFVVASAVPFFSSLLGLISALCVSGFSFYLPALMWWKLLREGRWNENRKNIFLSIVNGCIFLIGLFLLGCGTWAAAMSIKEQYASGSVGHPFECRWGVNES